MQKFRSNYGLHVQLPTERRVSKRAQTKTTTAAVPENNAGASDQFDAQIEETNADIVTREMKLEFVAKIKKLSNQGLTSLVNKVREVKA